MNLLYRVVYAAHARGTHHKLALDGLRLLCIPRAEDWQAFFLSRYDWYLTGSKEPDDVFKDFVNHVIHVEQNYWGGATRAAETWFYNTVRSMEHRDWDHAARAAGILSHYVVDPIMPFHTGQSTRENNIHRAVEWSISQSYDSLVTSIGSWRPRLPALLNTPDWLCELMHEAARESHRHYQTLIDRYDFAAGTKHPPSGLDATCRETVARLLALAAEVWARVLERVIETSEMEPPPVDVPWSTVLASCHAPLQWVLHRLADEHDRQQVRAIYREFETTGRVETHLPEECQVIRRSAPSAADGRVRQVVSMTQRSSPPSRLPDSETTKAPFVPVHRTMPSTSSPNVPSSPERSFPHSPKPTVLRTNEEIVPAPHLPEESRKPVLPLRPETHSLVPPSFPTDTASARKLPDLSPVPMKTDGSARFNLTRSDNVVDAPTIGPKMAARLSEIGILTVSDLLDAVPATIATGLKLKHVSPETVKDWQDQARMVCEIPAIHGHDAQILVGIGYRTPRALAQASLEGLAQDVARFMQTPEAERMLRSKQAPDRQEMADWIRQASQAAPSRAA